MAWRMRYLVTGGSGFIGSHLVEYLLAQGDQVTVVDIVHRPTKAMFVAGSVTDESLMDALIEKHDAVFHLASVVGFANVLRSTKRTILTSTIGSGEVFHIAAKHRKRTLFTSTSAVYGRWANGGAPVKESEDVVLGPTSTASWSYAYAKATDEALAFAYAREERLPVIVCRVFNTVGPRQSAEAGFVLPRFVRQAVQDQPLTVHKPGTQTRTFCHVKDTVAALARLMECDAAPGQLVNVGGNQTASILELADMVCDLSESSSRIAIVEPPYVGYDNVTDRAPDLTKLRGLINFAPQYRLGDMISDTIEECEQSGTAVLGEGGQAA